MEEVKNQSKIIVFSLIIIVLILVNFGIFYTGKITKLTTTYTTDVATKVSQPIELNVTVLDKLSNRKPVDVNANLNPNTTGRINPFTDI
jgi:hypothetical protein